VTLEKNSVNFENFASYIAPRPQNAFSSPNFRLVAISKAHATSNDKLAISHGLAVSAWWSKDKMKALHRSAILLILCTCTLVVETAVWGQHQHHQHGRLLRKGALHLVRTSMIEDKDDSLISEIDEEEKSWKYREDKPTKGKKKKMMKRKKAKAAKTKGTKAEKYKTKGDKPIGGESASDVDPEGNSILEEESNLSEISPISSVPSPTSEPTFEPTVEPFIEPSSEPFGQPSVDPTHASRPSTQSESSSGASKPENASPTDEPAGDEPAIASGPSSPSDADSVANKPEGVSATVEPAGDEPTIASRPSPTSVVVSGSSSPADASPAPVLTSDEACQLLSNGSFGETTMEGRDFEFFYQIETVSSMTYQTVNEDLLPLLEGALAGRLLAFLFDECRGEDITRRGESGSCEAQGYSGFPVDRVMLGGKSWNLMHT